MTDSNRASECATTLERQFDAELFRALGDETRLALIARLAQAAGPMTVTEAAQCCGVHLSGVSRHLAALRQAGIVAAQKEGREVRYSLDCGALARVLRDVAGALEACQDQCSGRKEQ